MKSIFLLSLVLISTQAYAGFGLPSISFKKPELPKVAVPKAPSLQSAKIQAQSQVKSTQVRQAASAIKNPQQAQQLAQGKLANVQNRGTQTVNRASNLTPSRGLASAQNLASNKIDSKINEKQNTQIGGIVKVFGR